MPAKVEKKVVKPKKTVAAKKVAEPKKAAAHKKVTAPKKAAAPKKETKPTAAKKKSPALECRICGYRVIVDQACGCVEEHVLVCCSEPMDKKKV